MNMFAQPRTQARARTATRLALAAGVLALLCALVLAGGKSAQAALDSIPALLGRGDGIGSNSWVVSGTHTITGKPPLRSGDQTLTVSQSSLAVSRASPSPKKPGCGGGGP